MTPAEAIAILREQHQQTWGKPDKRGKRHPVCTCGWAWTLCPTRVVLDQADRWSEGYAQAICDALCRVDMLSGIGVPEWGRGDTLRRSQVRAAIAALLPEGAQ